jgi:DNA-binding beta-propeller fold protein YncE
MHWWTLIFGLAVAARNVQTSSDLRLSGVADVRLPGSATRLDYQSVDPQKHLLFVAHLGDGNVIVFDTQARRVVASIPNVSAVHGVLAIPEDDVVFASATGTNEVVAFDELTLKEKWRLPGGTYPDGLAYDPLERRLFVSDEHGQTETIIDATAHHVIATIPLGGEAGNTQYDPVSRHVFVNVQTSRQLVEIDPIRTAVVRRYSIGASGCAGNHGLLIDARKRRAFVACEDSNSFLWIDMRDMRIVQTWKVGEQPDVLALDTRTRRLFVASEGGAVSEFTDGERVTLLAQAYFACNAHSVAVNSRTQLVYFPLQDVAGKPVLRVAKERP